MKTLLLISFLITGTAFASDTNQTAKTAGRKLSSAASKATTAAAPPSGTFYCNWGFSATDNGYQDFLNASCNNAKPFTQISYVLGGDIYVGGCCMAK